MDSNSGPADYENVALATALPPQPTAFINDLSSKICLKPIFNPEPLHRGPNAEPLSYRAWAKPIDFHLIIRNFLWAAFHSLAATLSTFSKKLIGNFFPNFCFAFCSELPRARLKGLGLKARAWWLALEGIGHKAIGLEGLGLGLKARAHIKPGTMLCCHKILNGSPTRLLTYTGGHQAG